MSAQHGLLWLIQLPPAFPAKLRAGFPRDGADALWGIGAVQVLQVLLPPILYVTSTYMRRTINTQIHKYVDAQTHRYMST